MPPAVELIALAPWVKPIPVPLATALIVTPVEPASEPADNAPVIVMAALLAAAVLVVTGVPQPRQLLSSRMWPGTFTAGTEMTAPLVLTI